MVKRAVLSLVLLCLLPACFGSREDEELRDLTQAQVRMLSDQVKGLDQSHTDLAGQLEALQASLNEMEGELARADARLVAAQGCNLYLSELSTVGFGPSPGRWTLENQALPARTLMMFGLAVVLCWTLYRVQSRRGESESMAEVERVLRRLNANPPPPTPAAMVIAPPEPESPVGPASAAEQVPAEPGPVEPPPVMSDPTPKSGPGSEPAAPPMKKTAPEAGPAPVAPAVVKGQPAADQPAKRVSGRREVKHKPVNRSQAKKCKVPGCPNKHRSKGYCNKHYQQWRRGGLVEGESEE